MPNKIIFATRDFDNDKQSSSINLIDTTVVANASTLLVGLRSWDMGSIGGAFFQETIEADSEQPSASPFAQGALQAIVEMVDSVNGRSYRERIPIPDLSKADDGGTNPAWIVSGGLTVANPAHADYALLQDPLELYWESPEGNQGTLARVYIEE